MRIAQGAVALLVGVGLVAAAVPASAVPAQHRAAGDYVVSFKDEAAMTALLAQFHVHTTQQYHVAVHGFDATLTAQQASLLASSPLVAGMMPNADVQLQSQTIGPDVPSVGADQAPVNAGDHITNYSGPAVAVIDSGVSPHPDLNLQGAVDCFDNTGDARDANGHGTGVSGYMAAYDNNSGMVGIAPGAPIYSVRVMDVKNHGTIATVVCGLNWVLANYQQDNIKVANLSLGTPGSDDGNCGYTNGDVMHQAICSLVADGVTVVASAANESQDIANFIPASYDEVLTATNDVDYDGKPGGLGKPPSGCDATSPDDTYVPSSDWAVSAADQAHTVSAPGVCPYTTKLGNTYGYIQSGTSMSAAATSGVVLDCLSAGGACVGQSVPQIRATIIAQAKASALRGDTFSGDPTSPIAGRYYGYKVSTIPVSGGTTPPPDTVAPTATVTSPANGATVAPGTITLTASASDNVGVTGVTFAVNGTTVANGTASGSGTYTATTDVTSYAGSTIRVTATASDAAGNVGTSAANAVTVSSAPPPDTTPPTATVTSPANGSTVAPGSVTLTASAADNVGVTGLTFAINGTKVATGASTGTGTYSASTDVTAYAGTTISITATATDAAGNTGTSAPVSVTVSSAPPPDTTPPTATVTSPANGSTVAPGSVTLTASAADNVGVTALTFAINGTKVATGASTGTGTYSASTDVTAYAGTTISITATATDAAGNTGTSAPVSVTVSQATTNPPPDTTPPKVSILSPTNSATVSGTVPVTISATDNTSVSTVTLYSGSTKLGTATPNGTPNQYSLQLNSAASPNGRYPITAKATDPAGNVGSSATIYITIKN